MVQTYERNEKQLTKQLYEIQAELRHERALNVNVENVLLGLNVQNVRLLGTE